MGWRMVREYRQRYLPRAMEHTLDGLHRASGSRDARADLSPSKRDLTQHPACHSSTYHSNDCDLSTLTTYILLFSSFA